MLEKLKQSVKDTVEPKPHIVEARQIAEVVFNKIPQQQAEMLIEIRARLVKLAEQQSERLNNL
tara:strand:- start:12505 stop:12693 length:189 start_codon:yes stop_codon:yes gene_type:complete